MVTQTTVSTDAQDYAPGSWVEITAAGFDPGSTVTFQVQHAGDPGVDGIWGTLDDVIVDLGGQGHEAWSVVDGGALDLDSTANGAVVTSWYVNPDDSLNWHFLLTAMAANQPTASTGFTDAAGSTNKVYQHWADGDAAIQSAAEWNNNILNANKSDYFEGEVIPHVFIYKASSQAPLVNGQSYSFNVTYNYYQQNTDALGFDYLTTFNISRTPGQLGVTNPAIIPTLDGSFTNNGGFTNFGSVAQGIYAVDADITSVSGITTSGSGTLNHTVTITFTYTGATTSNGVAEIYYGLHLAGPSPTEQGASAWTGGSLQTTVDIGGSGATSIQFSPAAIMVGSISGVKFNDLNGNGLRDAGESGIDGVTIYLDLNNDGQLDGTDVFQITASGGLYSFSVTPDANKSTIANDPYIVREVVPDGWMQTTVNPLPILISALDPTESNVNFGNMPVLKALHIEKDADLTTVQAVGETITYTYLVTNTGNVAIASVDVVDDNATPGMPSDDFSPTYVSGDANSDGKLDTSETWKYTSTKSVTQAMLEAGGSITNIAVVTGDGAISDQDDASVAVSQTKALHIEKDADLTTVQAVGETITYTYLVTNTGNVAIASVDVVDDNATPGMPSDDFSPTYVSGDANSDGKLDTSETWKYTSTKSVTQAMLEAGGSITNIAVVTGDGAISDQDDASVAVSQTKALHIEKDADLTTVQAVGETITYTYLVTNTGNVAIASVDVVDDNATPGMPSDDFSPTYVSGDANSDGKLDTSETWKYTSTKSVTQAMLESGGSITNIAVVTGDGAISDQDDATVQVVQKPALQIEKQVSLDGSTWFDADGATGPVANVGQAVYFRVIVLNTGNVNLMNVDVKDQVTAGTGNALDFTFELGDQLINNLAPGETVTSQVIQVQALSGQQTDLATAFTTYAGAEVKATDYANYYGKAPTSALIAPTSTTISQYLNGSALSFQQYYDFQGGVIQYSTSLKTGKISQTNPGVLFYFTGASGSIKVADGKTTEQLSVTIDQTVTLKSGTPITASLTAVQNNIQLYQVVDANQNGKYDAGETVNTLSSKSYSVTTLNGDITLNFTGKVGSFYVASVKYDTSSVIGTSVGKNAATWPTVNYQFDTVFKMTTIETYAGGVDLAPKKLTPMLLEGEQGHGARAVSDAQIKHVINAAMCWWEDHGITAEQLVQLKSAVVEIADLGEDAQGWWLGNSSGSLITIDDDAADHGWSLGLGDVAHNKVDLFSVLVHEMGHVLGKSDAEMGSTLAVGERMLPEISVTPPEGDDDQDSGDDQEGDDDQDDASDEDHSNDCDDGHSGDHSGDQGGHGMPTIDHMLTLVGSAAAEQQMHLHMS